MMSVNENDQDSPRATPFPPSDIPSQEIYLRRKNLNYTNEDGILIGKSLFHNNYVDYILPNYEKVGGIEEYLKSQEEKVTKLLKKELLEKKTIKSNMFLVCLFSGPYDVTKDANFKTFNSMILDQNDISDFIATQYKKILKEAETYSFMGSGFTFRAVKCLEVRVSKYRFIPGSCFISLPKCISDKKAVTNLKCSEENCNKCFLHCIVAAKAKRPGSSVQPRIEKKYMKKFTWNITFPVGIPEIKQFMKDNPQLSINVFSLDEKNNIFPMFVPRKKCKEHYNLLYICSRGKAHYCLINDLSRLIGSSLSKIKVKKEICTRCLLHFHSVEKLNDHEIRCSKGKLTHLSLPKPGSVYKFEKHGAALPVPFLISMDLESFLVPVDSCMRDPSKSYSEIVQIHEPFSFGAALHSIYDQSQVSNVPLGYHSKITDGKRLGVEIINYLDSVSQEIAKIFSRDCPIQMSAADEEGFQAADKCYVCSKQFTENNVKVRDHDHLISDRNNYRGAACSSPCNLNMKKVKFVPIFIMNLSNYDGHYLVKLFLSHKFNINVIPCTSEKYISFSIRINKIEFRFLDLYRFFPESLDSLAAVLPFDKFHQTKLYFDPSVHDYVCKKGEFPYQFLTGPERLNASSLPEKSFFYNDLSDTAISDEAYERAKTIWRIFKCRTFKDFVDVYQKRDVLCALDVLLFYRELIFNKFKIDLCHFLTISQLSVNLMLKHTGIEIELLTESEIYDFVDSSIMGGISVVNKRFETASETCRIFYTDCTALYSFIMLTFPLPYANYKFISPEGFDWKNINPLGEKGYVLEIDCSFNDNVHQRLSCLPPFPIKKCPPNALFEKLILDFEPKKKYITSLAMLQQASALGVSIDKIHRVLEFSQKNYMRPYVEILQKFRSDATCTSEKNLWKLICNSTFGKMIEDLKKRKLIKLVSSDRALQKLVKKPTFIDRIILSEGMAIVEMHRGKIVLDRPIIVGQNILFWSKYYMYWFFYDVLKKKFGSRLTLCLMDTDAYIVSIKSDNFYQEMKSISQYFDFSSLPPSHPLYSTDNACVYGSFKDETKGVAIKQFAAPRSKMYSFVCNDEEVKKAKGVKRSAICKLTHEDYVNCVLNNARKYSSFYNINSKDHELYTMKIQKLALDSSDDKRKILDDGICTLPYGHYALR
ncbi:uncharacterized protein LOC132196114 [Neocloeon triangulifer]|uniref:uncharacterized protein LOC132196114 n=1 Tax=Neocloeon triangulifer TaxID=2078957 RepID=UPI00286ED539|nr:uncharacterized protein LOC132196114 [Neocloeon triangulifer]